ncbi:MAG: hypothetical protein LBL96_10920 [Clostridiales bacterium]|nr:hypothetical protein [Clostridiales bacterium]
MKRSFDMIERYVRRSLVVCAVAAVVVCSARNFAFAAEADTINDGEYLANLIYSTPEEGTCNIPEGEYTVSGITITRPMTIRANGNVTIRPELNKTNAASVESNFIFSVWSDGVSIEGIHFKSPYAGGSVGIIHCKGDDLNVRDNTFSLPSNSAAIISYASSNLCMMENNRFISYGGGRVFPMIQFLDANTRVCLVGNTLEGAEPEMLTHNYLDYLIALGNKSSVVKDNQFEYTGFLTAEDMGGYEDENFVFNGDEPSAEAFMRIQSDKAKEFNPWSKVEGSTVKTKSSSGKSKFTRGDGEVATPENPADDADDNEGVKANPKTDGQSVIAPLVLAAALFGALAISIEKLRWHKKAVRK